MNTITWTVNSLLKGKSRRNIYNFLIKTKDWAAIIWKEYMGKKIT